MADLNPETSLALSYVPARRRPAIEALFGLDAALGAVLAGGREPMISRIKLAWWREALERLDRETAPPEPVLQAIAEHVLPAGIPGSELAEMEEGWAALLSDEPLTPEVLATYASKRGGLLFACAARLLGGEGETGGEAWALVDLARRTGNAEDREAALAAARALPVPARLPPRLRPLGMLSVLARRDAQPGRPHWEPQGAPKRMVRMLVHRLSGF
jgi:phytoene synthase